MIVHISLLCCEEFNAKSSILPICFVVRCAAKCLADVLVLPLVYFLALLQVIYLWPRDKNDIICVSMTGSH